MSGAVAVCPNPRAQSPRLNHQLLARHRFEILVHSTSFTKLRRAAGYVYARPKEMAFSRLSGTRINGARAVERVQRSSTANCPRFCFASSWSATTHGRRPHGVTRLVHDTHR